jgi:hypothetical protein
MTCFLELEHPYLHTRLFEQFKSVGFPDWKLRLIGYTEKVGRSISGFTFSILKKYLRWFFCVPHSADIQQTAYPNKHMLPPY